MRRGLFCLVFAFTLGVLFLIAAGRTNAEPSSGNIPLFQTTGTKALTPNDSSLSPYWEAEIQEGAEYISALSATYGFHPDLIAALIKHESDSQNQSNPQVGLMGLMPARPATVGTEPVGDAAYQVNNLQWGMAILSFVVQRSGGDLFTALSAYRGGWGHIYEAAPRQFAVMVLDSYVRAIVSREGLALDPANRWTLAIEVRGGHTPAEQLLFLGGEPLAGSRRYSEHTIYAFAGNSGQAYYIKGYIVPVGMSELSFNDQGISLSDQLEAPLRARMGEKSARSAPGTPRILLACLPSLERLRGQLTTRWYAPSTCPKEGR